MEKILAFLATRLKPQTNTSPELIDIPEGEKTDFGPLLFVGGAVLVTAATLILITKAK